jgi:hypothetical protein
VSIFQKDCPQCAGSNPSEALFCRCGYCYDPSQVSSHDEALTHVVNEEQNYLEYLNARVTQLQAELEAMLAKQILVPNDATLAADVLLARQALNSARAEQKLQSDKVESLSRQRKTARRKLRVSMPAVASAPAAKPHNGRVKSAKPPVASKPAEARPVLVMKPLPPAAPIRPAPVAASAPVTRKPNTGNLVRIQPKVSETPGTAFHAVQAAKADKAVTHRPPAPVIVPAPSLAPLSAVHELSADIATPLPARPEADPNTQDCPNCMAKLSIGTNKCRCGFDLTARFEMPALSLSAADVALLIGKLGYGS